jgi:hypothetical protein
MEPARLIFRTRRDLFVCPGAMSKGTFQQGTVLKLVRENRFQQVKVRKCDPLCLQDMYDCNKAGSVVEVSDKASGYRMKRLRRLAQ